MTLPAQPVGAVSTTVTTGVVAVAYGCDAGLITGFATRFGSTFDEYRILGVDAEALAVSPSTGATVMWFDEKDDNNPTANASLERTASVVLNTNTQPKSRITRSWRARDLLDLQYTPIGTTNVVPVAFKIYTDNVNWGAPITVTPLWIIRLKFHIEFRGIKST